MGLKPSEKENHHQQPVPDLGKPLENTRIIKAKNRDEAYAKALELSSEGNPNETVGGEWNFVGISQLIPIHEALEDGAEILRHDRGNLTASQIKRLLRSKNQLAAFRKIPEE